MAFELSERPHIVVTVHGIRTFGKWQERLEALVPVDANVDFFHYKFGYFSTLAFIIPIFRWLVVRSFRLELQSIIKNNSLARIDLIGHSFGTHLIAWAVAKSPKQAGLHFHTIILAGSVLKSSFPWRDLLGARVVRLVNDCGTRDRVLLLSQFFVLFTGMAGRTGFSGATSKVFRNRYKNFGHSGYFVGISGAPHDQYMFESWVPLILDEAPIAHFDERQGSFSEGVVEFLGNNAEPIKLVLYLGPLLILCWVLYSFWAAEVIRHANFVSTKTREFAENGDYGLAIAAAKEVLPSNSLSALFYPTSANALAALYTSVVEARPVIKLGQLSDDRLVPVNRIVIKPNSEKLVAVGDFGTVAAFDVASHERFGLWMTDNPETTAIISKGGSAIAIIHGPERDVEPHIRLIDTDPATPSGDFAYGAKDVVLDTWHHNVSDVSFSPDGSLVATAGDRLSLWRAIDGKWIRDLINFKHRWELEEGEKEHKFTHVSFSPMGGRIVATATDGSAFLFSSYPYSRSRPILLEGHRASVNWAEFSKDGELVVTASADRTVKVWSSSGELLKTLDQQRGDVLQAFFAPDTLSVVTASQDGEVSFWEVSTGYRIRNVTPGREIPRLAHAESVKSVEYSNEGSFAASVSLDGEAILWDAKQGSIIDRLRYGKERFTAVAFSSDEKRLYLGSSSGSIFVATTSLAAEDKRWDRRNLQPAAAFLQNQAQIIAASGGRIVVSDIASGVDAIEYALPSVGYIYTSHESSRILVNTQVGGIFDILAGRFAANPVLLKLTPDIAVVDWARGALSPTGNYIATFWYRDDANPHAVQVWDFSTLREQGSVPVGRAGEVRGVSMSEHAGKLSLALRFRDRVELWTPSSNSRELIVQVQPREQREVSAVSLSSGGSMVAVGYWDGAFEVHHRDERDTCSSDLDSQSIKGIKFSPQSETFLVLSDKALSAVKGRDCSVTVRLPNNDDILDFELSPDGKVMAGVGTDQTVKLWEAPSGISLGNLRGHGDVVTHVLFSEDGRSLLTASQDSTVRLWKIPSLSRSEVMGKARAMSPRSLSPIERRLLFFD
ncbi:WD40 repeat domain-containing protein [Sinorhizobium meliloti]